VFSEKHDVTKQSEMQSELRLHEDMTDTQEGHRQESCVESSSDSSSDAEEFDYAAYKRRILAGGRN
jgi:hypothetical protein